MIQRFADFFKDRLRRKPKDSAHRYQLSQAEAGNPTLATTRR